MKEHRSVMVMGTIAEVTIYGEDEGKTAEAMKKVFTVFDDVDDSMSVYKKESELSLLNAAAYESPVRVSRGMMELIEKSIAFSRMTDGAFDVTVGPLMEIWGFISARKDLPGDEAVRSALEKVGCKKIVIDKENQTVGFTVPGMWIDLGGIAKGYAVDLAVDELRKEGIENALVNLGGNIYALGSPPGESAWKVGIRDPLKAGNVLKTLRLKNRAAATSGSYERFVRIGEKSYSHIMDPRTGLPAAGVLSVTVTADTAIETDALSTAFFVLGYARSKKLIGRLHNTEAFFVLPGSDDEVVFIRIKG
ncbi:MAG: FAD:protein FMN transferase [bacterium]